MSVIELQNKTNKTKLKTTIQDIHVSGLSLKTPNSQTHLMVHRDRDAAIRDLKTESFFVPVFTKMNTPKGPFTIDLSIQENRLVFQIQDVDGKELPLLVLSLKPYKRLIQDYFMIVRSYDEAVKNGQPSRLEAIDMGRRGLHNEGAEMLMDRLRDKIEMDFDTARRLFTLICALHENIALLWR